LKDLENNTDVTETDYEEVIGSMYIYYT